MSRYRRIGLGAFIAVGALSAGVVAWGANLRSESANAPVEQRYTPTPRGNFTLAEAKAFDRFELFYPGASAAGLTLAAVNRVSGRTEEPGVQPDRVSFLYGTCTARLGHGCMPPLQIQVWNACERYQALYPFEPDESLEVRGAPAAFYEDHTRLEVYSGMATIVIFGKNREQLLAVGRSLKGLNRTIAHSEKLPSPAQGARGGTLDCQQ